MRSKWIVVAVVALSGCSSLLQPGFGERDRYVVNTPEYPDNRVFYLGKGTPEKVTSLIPGYDITTTERDPVHGQPMTVIVNSVGLPYDKEKDTVRRDLALILDIQAESQGNAQSIVVWYQRGVLPGQTLNFSNLLIYNQPSWDDRVAPFFRMRLMDVSTERNLETREALAEVSKYGGGVALALQNPGLSPVISTAVRAASLVLSSHQNSMVLDYTVQFYGKDRVLNSPDTYLTPLKLGRFVLVGRRPNDLSDSKFWRKQFFYDEINGTIESQRDSTRAALNTPAIVLSVTNQDAIVPTFVAAKSAYLTRLLTEASVKNLDELSQQSTDLSRRIDVYVLREKIYRYRQIGDVDKLVVMMQDKDDPLPSDVSDSVFGFLRKISGCSNLTAETIGTWWGTVRTGVQFKADKVELDLKPSDCNI